MEQRNYLTFQNNFQDKTNGTGIDFTSFVPNINIKSYPIFLWWLVRVSKFNIKLF